MITSPFLVGRDRYERTTEGWVDNTHEDAFTHTVAITDDDCSIELSVIGTPSPGYEVRGFATGGWLFVDAGIEVARLARQATKLPAEATAGLERGDALRCWQLDTTGWIDLPNSCFTYSEAGRALLGTRPVSTPMVPELYTPPAGAKRIFVRKKLSRLVLTARRLHLFHSMHDNVHGFDLHYEVDLDSRTIVAADSITSRLPYQGICTEPQGKIAAMIGQPADASLRKRIQGLLGGEAGCAQLYDLTADVLKLVTFPS